MRTNLEVYYRGCVRNIYNLEAYVDLARLVLVIDGDQLHMSTARLGDVGIVKSEMEEYRGWFFVIGSRF